MFALLLILLLTIDIGYALQCITNCSLGSYRFDQTFNIPDGQCQQRKSESVCSIQMIFNYHDYSYDIIFDTVTLSDDFFYIASGPYLSYRINYPCSKETDCVLAYARNRINEMVDRTYDAGSIYAQIAPLIKNPLRNGSIQCYNMRNEIIVCSSDELCSLNYDQRGNKFRSRGCKQMNEPRVYVYDGGSYASFNIECNRNLCNTEETFSQIKTIVANNGLTDANGRRIDDGNKQIVSSLLITLALIPVVVSYLCVK